MNMLSSVFVLLAGVFGSMDPSCTKLPGDKSPTQCCAAPQLISDSVIESCRAANPMPDSPPPLGKFRACCMSECVLNTTGINVNGLPNQQKAIEFLTDVAKNDSELVQVLTNAVNFCAALANTKLAAMITDVVPLRDGEKACNVVSGFMLGCVHGQAFKNCPASKWTSDSDCNSIKSHVDRCGFLMPFKFV